MQSLPDHYPIFIQQNVRFLDRTASSERSFMCQRRLTGKLLGSVYGLMTKLLFSIATENSIRSL